MGEKYIQLPQDVDDSVLRSSYGEVTSPFGDSDFLADATTLAFGKQHDVWGDGLFSLLKLDTDMEGDRNQPIENIGRSTNDNVQTAQPHLGTLMHAVNNDGHTTGFLAADSRTMITPTSSPQPASSCSSVQQQSVLASVKNSVTNPPMACSMVYTSPNQLRYSSFVSGGSATMPPNCNNNNNMAYQQASPVPSLPSGNFSPFFTTSQTGGNVVMFAPSSPSPQLCLSATAPTMIPCYVFTPPQHGIDVNEAMAYSPLASAAPPMGAVMCGSWSPTAVSVAGAATANSPGLHATSAAVSHTFPSTGGTLTTQPAINFTSGDSNQNFGSMSSIPCSDTVSTDPRAASKGSPPSYDSLRLQLTRRRQPLGRQRSGTNVHGKLQGGCAYYSYNLSAALKQYEQPDLHPARPGEQVLPIFIQMFPCELRDRTIIVLNRVVEATCGPDVATVVGIEPRSETSFITLVRTNAVWLLIHKLRCRVLMDRHGFWYAENMRQYMRLKTYCESVRRLPQQMRHLQTDGLPCMPLVVELSRSVNAAAVTSPSAAPSFDKLVPIATVDRHPRPNAATGCGREKSAPLEDDDDDGEVFDPLPPLPPLPPSCTEYP